MTYHVVWDVEAYRKLEQIWTHAADIGPSVRAFDEIERLLATAPEEQGESRASGRRVLIVPPLGIIYRVQSRLQEVYVQEAWEFRRRQP